MTFNTDRHNIKPVFRLITFIVLVLLGWFRTAMAEFGIGTGQFTNGNSIIDSTMSFNSLRMASFETFLIDFVFLTLSMALMSGFAFFALGILQPTSFTLIPMSIFIIMFLVKFSKRFDLLAFRATFAYDLLRHNLLLTRRLRLEPISSLHDCGRLVLL